MTKKEMLTTLREPQTVVEDSDSLKTGVKSVRLDGRTSNIIKSDSVKSFTPSIEQYLQKVQPLSPLGELSDETYYSDKSSGVVCQNPHSSGKYMNYLYIQLPNSKECIIFTDPRIENFYLKNLKKV